MTQAGSGSEHRILQLGLIQMACGEDPATNLETAMDGVRGAAERGAEVICLQELFRTRYFCQRRDRLCFEWAETIPGPTTRMLGNLARELGIVLVASLFERHSTDLHYNTAVVIGPDGRLRGRYRKIHIPGDPYYQEKFYFAPGDLGFPSHSTPHVRLGVLVCWDQWFPEAARATALQGAQLILCPTAIGWVDDSPEKRRAEADGWETIQRGHALANGVFWAAVNRVGREDGITFWGQSFVCDPFGRVLARSPADREDILIVSCDLSRIEAVRREWPFLEERRTEAYGELGISPQHTT